jgi:hypothetical protein
MRRLQDCIKEYVSELSQDQKDEIKLVTDSRDLIKIEYKDGNRIEVYYINSNNKDRTIGRRNIDMAFCDECYPNKEYIDSILKPMDIKQVYIMITNDNIEYIDSRKSKEFNYQEFFKQQIIELMIEYSKIVKNEKTTMTRENILKQIKILDDLRSGK